MMAANAEVQVYESDFPNGSSMFSSQRQKLDTHTGHRYVCVVLFCVLLTLSGVFYVGYFCPDAVCALSNVKNSLERPWSLSLGFGAKIPIKDNMGKPVSFLSHPIHAKQPVTVLSYKQVLDDDFRFDMKGHDVMVFLHIQKTGGTTFGRHLVLDLDLERPCICHRRRKRCDCFRPNRKENWLFSRYSTGWKCGLHADWTELTNCVDEELDRAEGDSVKRRYFYITLLREPINRYLSEFRHVQRGATWKNSRHWCGGREATEEDMPACYEGDSWEGVSLEDFVRCQWNLAADRQTRMLADLTLVGCYNRSYMEEKERKRVLLASAKRNLASMAFFGLTEHQQVSQYVFEQTFNLRFRVPFEQWNATYSSHTRNALSSTMMEEIKELNGLDLELYDFAEALLQERFRTLRDRDPNFKEHFQHLGEMPGDHFSWEDID